jgi:hypothetical protein
MVTSPYVKQYTINQSNNYFTQAERDQERKLATEMKVLKKEKTRGRVATA